MEVKWKIKHPTIPCQITQTSPKNLGKEAFIPSNHLPPSPAAPFFQRSLTTVQRFKLFAYQKSKRKINGGKTEEEWGNLNYLCEVSGIECSKVLVFRCPFSIWMNTKEKLPAKWGRRWGNWLVTQKTLKVILVLKEMGKKKKNEERRTKNEERECK